MWTPISKIDLQDLISRAESVLTDNMYRFWKLINVEPEKWREKEYGDEGGGFWIVAILGNNVIYYNDIEEGFNISEYEVYGEIKEYWCNQSDLDWEIIRLYNSIIEKPLTR